MISLFSIDSQLLTKAQLDKWASLVLARVKHPILQRNLVRVLPSRSPLTASMQRYLALSFLVHPLKVTHPLGSPEVLELIRTLLQSSPKFRITKDTDYADLAAQFTLLDMAIGAGPLAVPYQPLISPPASPNSQELSLLAALTPPSDEVRKFNKEVDALAQHIRFIGNSINVAGAITDLTRLAANDCCERLCTRLESAVRIGGKRVNDVFKDEEEGNVQGKAIFRNWLSKRKTGSTSLDERLTRDGASKRFAVADGDGEGSRAQEDS